MAVSRNILSHLDFEIPPLSGLQSSNLISSIYFMIRYLSEDTPKIRYYIS